MAAHKYYVDGVRVPSVTLCLKLSDFYGKSVWFTEQSRQEGTYIHEMINLFNRNLLNEVLLPDLYRPRLDAWKRFRDMSGFEPTLYLCEQPVTSPGWRYGGTPDIVGKCALDDLPAVIDLKRGPLAPSLRLQLAGYALALPDPYYKRFGVHLGQNGRPQVKEYNEWPQDRQAFLATVTTAHNKIHRGLYRYEDDDVSGDDELEE